MAKANPVEFSGGHQAAFRIPLIINSEKRFGQGITTKTHTKDGEISFHLPEVTDSDIEKLSTTSDVHELSINEIIDFYVKVGKLWGNHNYDLRKDAVQLAVRNSGYSAEMIEHAYDQIAGIFSKQFISQTIKSEIQDEAFLDDWLKVDEIYVHAQPRGRVLHILAGNAPPISAVSMLRGSLTKNSNIIKMASGDLVTSIYLASSFLDVDADHPITKTTSVVYWPHGSLVEEKIIHNANAVCVWGGKDVIESTKAKTRPGTELLEFGPRRSMQFIGHEAFESKNVLQSVTDKAAHDIVLFDQEACHSPQLAFVEGKGNAETFCEALSKSMVEECKRLPKGFTRGDKHASISHERILAKFYGEKVYESEKTEWTIILSDKVQRTQRHPLGRMLYVFEIPDLKGAIHHIDKSVQTVAVFPEKRIVELRDEITKRGADRVTSIGRMGYFATGAPHEGVYPLSRLVRWVKSR